MVCADLLLLRIATCLRRRIGRLLRCRFLCGTVARFLSIRFGHELTLFGLPVKLAVLVIDLRTCVDPHEAFRLCVCDFSLGRRGCRDCLGRGLAGFLADVLNGAVRSSS